MKPDFLYIGAPRSGSTWLFKKLSTHPQIWLPPCKNILYFHPRFQRYRLKILKYYGREAFTSNAETRKWYTQFFLSFGITDKWYKSLYPQTTNLIKGEIAEAYCSLSSKDVARIKSINPDLKIIFTLRNPMERAISHAKLGVLTRKNKTMDDIEKDALLKHINHPSSVARSSYIKTLETWEEHFPKEQFLIQFYEDFQSQPQTYLKNICEFLNVEYRHELFEKGINKNINASNKDDIPNDIIAHTALKYKEEISALADRFGSHASQWDQDINRILK